MASDTIADLAAVWKRQKRNWRIIAIRQCFNRFFMEMTRSYTNIYIMLLGASPIQLGIINSFLGISNTIISVPMGWLQDRYNLRKLFIMGIGLLAIVPLIYANAPDWIYIIPAIIIMAIASKEASCMVLCNVCLDNRDRLTAKGICEGIGRIPSLAAPIIASFIIAYLGGINLKSIQFLYWIQFGARFILFIYIYTQLTDIIIPKKSDETIKKPSFMTSFKELFAKFRNLKKWILFCSLGAFIRIMMMSFRYPFAYSIKNSNEYIIGLSVTSSILLQVILYIPLGRLSDKIGRKKVLFMLMPITWISYLLFVFSPNPGILVFALFLSGIESIVMVIYNAISAELVTPEYMGRWIGIIGLFSGLSTIPAPILGGYIWDYFGPEYIFILPIFIDIILRIPLLVSIPETLNIKYLKSD